MPFNMLNVGCLPVETQWSAQRYTLLEECSLPLGYADPETRWGWLFGSLPWAAGARRPSRLRLWALHAHPVTLGWCPGLSAAAGSWL